MEGSRGKWLRRAFFVSIFLVTMGMIGRSFLTLAYLDEIKKASREAGVSPFLVAAVVFQESRCRPEARSPAGAVGLMQLMPETAHWVGATHRLPSAPIEEPETNLRLGTLYLRELLDLYEGDSLTALAAYNAGPGAVDHWRRGQRLRPEEIRYRETREYVRRVQLIATILPWLYPELVA